MSEFVSNQWFEIEECCNCHVQFAMTQDFVKRRRKDHEWFYCPAGHKQHYIGKTEEQKLKAELQRANSRADEMQRRASEQRERAEKITRSYKRVRDRVKNGVCPCCTRTFENLARHMKTKHPELGDNQQLRTMRLAYGLTQEQLAKECGVLPAYVSLYERGIELPRHGQNKLDAWIVEQSA